MTVTDTLTFEEFAAGFIPAFADPVERPTSQWTGGPGRITAATRPPDPVWWAGENALRGPGLLLRPGGVDETGLLVPQRLDGIEAGGAHRRVQAEPHADSNGHD